MNADQRRSTLLDRVFHSIFPLSLLDGTPWIHQWRERERRQNLTIWRVVFTTGAIVYIAHYYYLDLPLGLEPAEKWFNYRFGMAVLFGLCVASTYIKGIAMSRLYRLPAYFCCWNMAFWQAKSMLWYEDSIYLYAFAFIVINSAIIRTSLAMSLAFAIFTLFTQFQSFVLTGVSLPLLYSAAAVSLIFVYVTRSSYIDEIRYFLAIQQNIESQKNAIEMNIEFNDRIRALLPMEISRRLNHYLRNRGWTVLQAMDEVLQPRTERVSCVYSDIRGYTQGTKSTQGFLYEGVLPNVRACTSCIEENTGIPKKVGDLIFGYFDSESAHLNLLNCLSSATELYRTNAQFNEIADDTIEIKRQVLVSSGSAVVGNLGGMDSSVEITALGSPVNFLARLDELTKDDDFQKLVDAVKLSSSHTDFLITCQQSKILADEIGLDIGFSRLDLRDSRLNIRDFSEVTELWLVPICEETDFALHGAISQLKHKYDATKRSPSATARI